MSDKMRWRYGDTNPVVAAVDAETVIEIGDLLWLDVDDAKPASAVVSVQPPIDLTEEGWMEGERDYFTDRFLGVAMQRTPKGETAPIRVATTGVFEFDCPPYTFELGDLIGLDVNATGNALLNQRVETVAESRCAIGRVAKRQAIAATTVLVDIRSRVMGKGI